MFLQAKSYLFSGIGDHCFRHFYLKCALCYLDCKTFMEIVQEVAESQRKKDENIDASTAAGLLEKLSVEENKSVLKDSEKVPVAAKGKESETESEKVGAEKKGEEPISST